MPPWWSVRDIFPSGQLGGMIIMRKQAEATKRNRTEQIKFWATPEEKDLILKKM